MQVRLTVLLCFAVPGCIGAPTDEEYVQRIAARSPALDSEAESLGPFRASGTVTSGGKTVWFRVVCAAPDERSFVIGSEADGCPLLVESNGRALVFDFLNDRIVLFESATGDLTLAALPPDLSLRWKMRVPGAPSGRSNYRIDLSPFLVRATEVLSIDPRYRGRVRIDGASLNGTVVRTEVDPDAAYPIRLIEATREAGDDSYRVEANLVTGSEVGQPDRIPTEAELRALTDRLVVADSATQAIDLWSRAGVSTIVGLQPQPERNRELAALMMRRFGQ